jgi:hypothetical protein
VNIAVGTPKDAKLDAQGQQQYAILVEKGSVKTAMLFARTERTEKDFSG